MTGSGIENLDDRCPEESVIAPARAEKILGLDLIAELIQPAGIDARLETA